MIDSSLIFDGTLNYGSAPTGAAITNSRISTNVIDLLAARDMGAGDVAELHVDVTTAFTTTNSATLQVAFQVSAATNSGFVNLLLSPVAAAGDLIVGAPFFRYELPLNQILNDTSGVLGTPGRYLALYYTVGTGVFSAGAVFSYINAHQDRTQYTTYPRNYTAPTS